MRPGKIRDAFLPGLPFFDLWASPVPEGSVEDDIDGVEQAGDVEDQCEDDVEEECSPDSLLEPHCQRRDEDRDDDEQECVGVGVGHEILRLCCACLSLGRLYPKKYLSAEGLLLIFGWLMSLFVRFRGGMRCGLGGRRSRRARW